MCQVMKRTKTKSQPLSGETLELIATRFRVLGEPMRLRLLNILQGGEKTVTELVEATGATQANVSKHLSVLATASLVARRKEGINVYYFISDPLVFELCELVCSGLRNRLKVDAQRLA